ncbi:MAG TPA: glycoside hydrolase family 15 protein, partial [Gaiellaceae bacterium]|nr:glycoside hydrolase family 15 protein [Gaiellaceae bacterium]
ERRYLPDSNVLETTFRTASGSVRVTDLMALTHRDHLAPLREVVRRVEGLAGSVRMRYRVEPRFGYGRARVEYGRRSGRPFASAGAHAVALSCWEAGECEVSDGGFAGAFEAREGSAALLVLSSTHSQPAVLPSREGIERRVERTLEFWPEWASRAEYDGPWRDAVVRSALALKLCVFAPSGAVVAAPTTALPETLGGARNWDYRFTWVRDASWTLDALLALGYSDEAHAFIWWLMHASRRTQPRLNVLYRVDGDSHAPERELGNLEGYRGSTPVRVGNGAIEQRQLDIYGALLSAIWLYATRVRSLDADTAKTVADIADLVARIWHEPDSGIWEVRSAPTHFVQSKVLCWVALDRAAKLAEQGVLPGKRAELWRSEADAIRSFVDEQGWDAGRGSYVRATDMRELDASLLTLPLLGWPDEERSRGTVDAVRRELGHGPYVYRYRGTDGVGATGEEGSFLTCSFWLADALARTGRVDDAAKLMDELVGLANDVGLFSEEVDPRDGSFLGNFPQALTHLALVNAAVSIAAAESSH